MKITMKEPEGPYSCTLDTEVMTTTITEAFIGPVFVTADGETLAVVMRDSGFELMYQAGPREESVSIRLNAGRVEVE